MEIKAYKKGDEIEILKLFQLAFGKEMSMDYWQWRFIRNPFCGEPFIDLMWEGNQLVGHYAVSPIDMIINNEEQRKTALSMTTMTHPDFGGKGIFSSLANSLYKRLEENEFSMVWGFPNNNSHYGFNKNLAWKNIAVQGMMILALPAIAKSIKNTSTVGSVVKCNEKNMENLSVTLNDSEKYIKIHKTSSYLKWRYVDNPTAQYKIATSSLKKGILIYKIIPSFTDVSKNEIDIMDWEFGNDINIALELLATVFHNEANIEQFNLWDSLFSNNQVLLEKIGFRLQAPLTYLGYRPLSQQDEKVGDYRNWDIGFGYSDIF